MDSAHLEERSFRTPQGEIAYWASGRVLPDSPWIVFLPGLTADHRLFEKQLSHFAGKANLLAWDPPSHGKSRPFPLAWTLDDWARWLRSILEQEGVTNPILVGQSMGGYLSQAYMDLFPGAAAGFVSIDSCPLKRTYYQGWELYWLKHTKLMFELFPWKTLVSQGAKGNSMTEYGQALMRDMMCSYDKRDFCALSSHGFRVLADAIEADRPYEIDCPVLLICGEKDNAGSAKRYNRAWEKREGHVVHWIEGAGHNSNTDNPGAVNALIEDFVDSLSADGRRLCSALGWKPPKRSLRPSLHRHHSPIC